MKLTPMRRLAAGLVLLVCLTALGDGVGQQSSRNGAPGGGSRFTWVNVFIDPGRQPLAAYQFEFTAATGNVTLVGIGGGDHAAFKEPPYYDPQALGQNHAILAAFNTGRDLPSGKTCVARIHLEVRGPVHPRYIAKIQAAANAAGQTIQHATIMITEGAAQ